MPPPSGTVQASSNWAFVWQQLRFHRSLLIQATAWRCVFRMLPVQVPLLAGALVDSFAGNPWRIAGRYFHFSDPATAVGYAGSLLVGGALLTGLAAFVSEHLNGRLSRLTQDQMRSIVSRAWLAASPSARRNFSKSQLEEQVLPEIRGIGKFATRTLVEGSAAVLRFAYPVLMLFWIHPQLALIPVAALLLQVFFTQLVTRHSAQFTSRKRQTRNVLRYTLNELLERAETWQRLNAEQQTLATLERASAANEDALREANRWNSPLLGIVWALSALVLALSWFLGAQQVLHGAMTLGTLVTFVGFASYLTVPLRRLAGASRSAGKALAGLAQLRQFLDALQPAQAQGDRPLAEGPVTVGLDGVTLAFSATPLLKEATVNLAPGRMVWLRGSSGSGKTTLLRLIAGLEQPQSGTVQLNGIDLQEYDPASLRRHVAILGGEPILISGRIRDNLLLNAGASLPSDLPEVLEWSGFARHLASLPDGLETQIQANRTSLSLIAAQQLCLARALLRRPRLLLLDEIGATWDKQSEFRHLEMLAKLRHRCTIIVAATNLRTLTGFDRVWELEHGQIREWNLGDSNSPSFSSTNVDFFSLPGLTTPPKDAQ